MSALSALLNTYRSASVTEREKGTYFEELVCTYLRNEATYRDLYDKVWTYAEWAKEQSLSGKDAGIDLVARTQGTGQYHAIQCKLYAEDYKVQKKDIDSFFTASGKTPFSHRVIVTTTNNWSEHAEDALQGQQPPVSKIDLQALEDSQIDWAKYQPNQAVALKAKKQLRDHQQTALNAVAAGLKEAERGKLIMACGTGKTFTSLKIAEQQAGKGKRVLFLVPSLSLLSQTLTEWTQESATPLHSFAVCSDSDVGKKRKAEDDAVQVFTHELRYPATTKADRLAAEMLKRHDAEHMSVVFIVLGDKDDKNALAMFANYSSGVKSQRDAWAYNAGKFKLGANMSSMIGFYNNEVSRFNAAHPKLDTKARQEQVDDFIDTDPTRISWTRALKQDLGKNRSYSFDPDCIVRSLYRPFTKQWLYFNRRFNEMVYQMPRIFPHAKAENLLIMVKQRPAEGSQLALMVNCPPELQSDGGTQCFPLYLYDEAAQASKDDLFAEPVESGLRRRDAITDAGLAHFSNAYPGEQISKKDLFYYVYGILHSPDYRARYVDNLSKELPRIPAVKKATDFWAFSKAGRALADLHLNYETVEPYPLTIEAKGMLTDADYRVEKMKLAKKGDKTTVIYNTRITLKGIPEAAWDYVVNGKAALDWVMERQRVKVVVQPIR